jgi:cytochrome c556
VPKRIAFGLAAASGAVLFGAHAEQYANNPWFWTKIALLALIAANYLLFRRTAFDDAGRRKLAAGLSLLLWTGVVVAARGPATVKDIMHSMVDPNGDFLFKSVQTIEDRHGITEIAPHTDAEWENVRQRLMILHEAPDLLQGRRAARPRDRSKNPEVESQPEDIQKLLNTDSSTFLRRAQKLQDAASVAIKAVDAKDKDALLLGLDGIDKACESCHLRYWYPNDKRAHEAAKEDGVVE